MAKSKKEPAPAPGAPAWMATFSDLMNLLLCFFVLLFSFSSIEEEVFEQISQSFNTTISVFDHGSSVIGDGKLMSNGVSELNELSDYFNSLGLSEEGKKENTLDDYEEAIKEENLKQSEAIAGAIEEELENNSMASDVEIDITAQYVQLVLNGSLLFNSGSAEVKTDAKSILNKIADILWKYEDCTIEIIGHCDNVPVPKSSKYDSNLELSCARAISVAKYLSTENGLSMETLKPSGRGEYEPVASNDTSEGRAQNRRVEIQIHFNVE